MQPLRRNLATTLATIMALLAFLSPVTLAVAQGLAGSGDSPCGGSNRRFNGEHPQVAPRSCCGEGCTCEPDSCACAVDAPTRDEQVPTEAPSPAPPHRLDMGTLPCAVPPAMTTRDALPALARCASRHKDLCGRSGGRTILLQSGVLRT